MSIGQRIFCYHAITWVIFVSLFGVLYLNMQPETRFYKSSRVYYSCPVDDYKVYEIVRSNKGRITAIYERDHKSIVDGRTYVGKTKNCAAVKVEEQVLDKQDQHFFEVITFRSNNEELY